MAQAPAAIHEAAHAIIGLDQNIVVSSITLGQHSDSVGGWVRYAQNVYGSQAVAVMSLAGAIAESRFLSEISRPAKCYPSQEDENVIPFSGRERKRLETIASQRISWLWSPIRAVARDLLVAGTLSHEHVLGLARPWKAFFQYSGRF